MSIIRLTDSGAKTAIIALDIMADAACPDSIVCRPTPTPGRRCDDDGRQHVHRAA